MGAIVPHSIKSPPPVEPLLHKIGRRFLLWSLVCIVSAMPSFVWAASQYDRSAMALGVAIFIVLYTVATCTPPFERFHDLPHIQPTLRIGYCTRLALSALFPVGMAIDMFPGIASVSLVELFRVDIRTFRGTLMATVIQGTILNFLIAIFMSFVYLVLRLRANRQMRMQPRGFDVVTTPLPVEPADSNQG